MSKNYTNYNKPQEAKKQNEVAVTPEDNEQTSTPVVDVTSLDQTDATADPATPVTPEDDDQTNAAETFIGVVSNCKMLNVRADTNTTAEIITILKAGDEMVVCPICGNDEWVEVHSVSFKGDLETIGFHGYCMKDFITIK